MAQTILDAATSEIPTYYRSGTSYTFTLSVPGATAPANGNSGTQVFIYHQLTLVGKTATGGNTFISWSDPNATVVVDEFNETVTFSSTPSPVPIAPVKPVQQPDGTFGDGDLTIWVQNPGEGVSSPFTQTAVYYLAPVSSL